MREFQDRSEEMDGALSAFAERTAAPLRAPVTVSDDFESRTMRALLAERAGFTARKRANPLGWLIEPRTIRVSPLAGLALAASLLIAVALGTSALKHRNAINTPTVIAGAPPAPAAAAETVHVVRFQLAAPGARSVALVGDFNDWARDAIVLKPAETPGVWTASVPLKPGRHEYAFIVDGKRWVPDPYANTHTDEYDVKSSVLNVGTAGTE